jgi:hypothetical protein
MVPQPLVVVTAWGTRGVAPLAALLLGVAVAFFFYQRALRRGNPLPLRAVLLACAAGLALAWCVPFLFSSDVYAYAAYGEMARVHLNPYLPVPPGTSDLIVRAAQVQWVSAFPICVYGPAFVEMARVVVALFAAFGFAAQLNAFRILASAALLLCAALAYSAYGSDRTARLRAAAAIALNPPAIWCAAEGHNDAIALAAVLAGFALMRWRRNAGAAIVALSGLFKLPGIAAAAAIGAANRTALPGALTGIAIALALSIPLIAGVTMRLARHGAYAPQASLQAVIAPLSPFLAWALALSVAALLGQRGVALLRAANVEGWVWLALAGWVIVPNPYPWYGIWLIAAAALAPRSRASSVAVMLSATSMLRYVPDAVATPSPPLAAVLGVAATLPLLALIPRRPAVIIGGSYDR